MLFSDKHKWFEKAMCAGNTDLFFPEIRRGQSSRKEYRQAIAICETCTVIKECLEYSLTENLIDFGVFGGKMPFARKILLRSRNRQSS